MVDLDNKEVQEELGVNSKDEAMEPLNQSFNEMMERMKNDTDFNLHLKLTMCTLELVEKAGPHMNPDEVQSAIDIVERGLCYFIRRLNSTKEKLGIKEEEN